MKVVAHFTERHDPAAARALRRLLFEQPADPQEQSTVRREPKREQASAPTSHPDGRR